MMTLSSALPELRRPFTPQAVRWKMQTNPDPDKRRPAVIVAYLDARLVAERLNAVCPGDWGHVFGPIQTGQGWAVASCRLTVLGQTREDVGWSRGLGSDMDAKTAPSDAFKRAAVHFGIGAFLYALPEIKLWANQLESYGNGKFKLGDDQLRTLAQRYAARVAHPAHVKRFGEPMDHGDIDADGDIAPAGQQEIPGTPPAPTGGPANAIAGV